MCKWMNQQLSPQNYSEHATISLCPVQFTLLKWLALITKPWAMLFFRSAGENSECRKNLYCFHYVVCKEKKVSEVLLCCPTKKAYYAQQPPTSIFSTTHFIIIFFSMKLPWHINLHNGAQYDRRFVVANVSAHSLSFPYISHVRNEASSTWKLYLCPTLSKK